MKKVTVAILNFNRSVMLPRAIRSALAQKVDSIGFEILVIDDGSTDGSERVVNSFPEVRLISLETNRGVGFASAVALEEAEGELFIRLDSDDFLSGNAVQTLYEALEGDPHCAFSYGDVRAIDEQKGLAHTILLDSPAKLYHFGAGVLFRRQVLIKLGGYDKELRNCEDLDLFLRLERAGMTGVRVPIPLYRYHIHGSNTSMDVSRRKLWDEVFIRNGRVPLPWTRPEGETDV